MSCCAMVCVGMLCCVLLCCVVVRCGGLCRVDGLCWVALCFVMTDVCCVVVCRCAS